MRGTQEELWKRQEVVTWKNAYEVPHFQATRVKIQGGLIFPTLFNTILDNVVRNWLALMLKDEMVAREGLGLAVGRRLGIFYADNSMVGSRYL